MTNGRTRVGRVLLGSMQLLLSGVFGSALAGELQVDSEVALEVRLFPGTPLYENQFSHLQPSVTIRPEFRWESTDGSHQIVAVPYVRLDSQDDARSHFDIREGYYRYVSDSNWSVLVGLARVFWGTTESRHLVDIINQTDAVEDIDEEDKLGQAMINFSLIESWGQIDLILTSGFRERTFPGKSGRLRSDPAVNTGEVIFDRAARHAALDVALRYEKVIGDWDIGSYIFFGTSREPRFLIAPATQALTPFYDEIIQWGSDLQYTKGAWLWKAEAIVRSGHGDVIFATVAGMEHTFYQLFDTAWDIGILAEYLYDNRSENFQPERGALAQIAPATAFQNDIFAGFRLAANDIQNFSLLGGFMIDVEDQSTSVIIESERRLGNSWIFSIESRLFFNTQPQNTLHAIRNDDFIRFHLKKFF